jgi:hypothetical protein
MSMRQTIARSSNLAVFRRILACCLLLTSVALPLQAWAVDTDGDGVEDSIDAFPNNAEANTDTDHDGAPDAIDSSKAPIMFSDAFNGTTFQSGWSASTSWSVSGGFAVYKGTNGNAFRIGRTFNVPSGGQLTFRHQRVTTASATGSGYLRVDSVNTNTLFSSTSWVSTTVNLSPGSHVVDWTGACTGSGCGFLGSVSVQFDDVVLKASSLTLDGLPSNAAASKDTDGDGSPDSWNAACDATCQANSGLVIDNCPVNINPDQLNTDGDAQGNACDTDDDNDGVLDVSDKFPLDATETLDNDNDGVGNNADTDDDNDTVLDTTDNCPLVANTDQLNTDGDAQGNACDNDDDNDGVVDASDEWPVDSRYTADTDRDTLPDNWEVDHGRDPAVADYIIRLVCEKNELGGACSPYGDMQPFVHTRALLSCYGPTDNSAVWEKYTPTSAGIIVTEGATKCSGGTAYENYLRTIAADHLVQVFYSDHFSYTDICFLDHQGKHCFSSGSSSSTNAHMNIDSDHDGVQRHDDPDDLDDLNPWFDTDADGIHNSRDLDDDNDGISDYIDADPLNAAINTEKLLPVNGGYKGSAIRESQSAP